ncbi:phosphatase [Bacillus tianshenii]|uniref:phosphatase n=1 Tax=Sutcliffiella tianshenii TaxID=1463404 RepID=UPI001CD354D4|nr:phosphatase [Bacillus tianshenii]MCA1318354.1 phosphatase [Bacillus tianshenii]
MQLKIFHDIDITDPAPPYFQVDESRRIRFCLTVLEKNPGLLKKIFKGLELESHTKLDCTFISAYESDGIEQKEKLHLGRRFAITNWKESRIWNDDLECTCVYTTITNLSASNLYNYMIALMRGHQRQLYICFYNEAYLLYESSDVLDILSSETNIRSLKSLFKVHYDKYHLEYKPSGGDENDQSDKRNLQQTSSNLST